MLLTHSDIYWEESFMLKEVQLVGDKPWADIIGQ